MEDKFAVSVIVPAYNAEKFIAKCLESILAQTLHNIQIIVVDDGSKDNTRAILRKYAALDDRIILIEKDKNEGLSAARNSAMKVAEGEYIGFVDSDDWIDADYYEHLYTQGNKADMVVTGYCHDTMNEQRDELYVSRTVNMPSDFLDNKELIVRKSVQIDSMKMFAYTWNKIYRRSVINKTGLIFTAQVLIEDYIFNTEIWNSLKTLSIVQMSGYHYVKASKDALTQKFLPDFMGIMNLRYDFIKKLLVDNNVYDGDSAVECANVYIKHMTAGVVRNCSTTADYSFRQQLGFTKKMLSDPRSKEARCYAKGTTKQEKMCNMIFKSNCALLELLFAKAIFMMQTKSKTLFDRMK